MESNHLPLGYEPTEIPLLQPAIILFNIQSGVPGEIRTLDQQIKSLLFSHLNYGYIVLIFLFKEMEISKTYRTTSSEVDTHTLLPRFWTRFLKLRGGPNKIWTCILTIMSRLFWPIKLSGHY